MSDEPRYETLVMFGSETRRSVSAPDTFQKTVSHIVDILLETGCKLACRGTVEGEKGKNVAPREAAWSSALAEKWAASLDKGRFKSIEFFDSAWAEGCHPIAYGALRKMWGFGPEGYSERTKEGAENNVTVAVRSGAVRDALSSFQRFARVLVDEIDAFYGSIETNVPWDRPRKSMRVDMIDLRWQTRTSVDYRRGKYRVQDMVPRLYKGNILCSSQLVDGNLEELSGLPGVAKLEEWSPTVRYLQLNDAPEYSAKPSPLFAKFVRFIPE